MSACSSCSAPIIWALTEKDKRMPLDAEPVDGAEWELYELDGVDRCRYVGDQGDLLNADERYVPHWATCPQGAEWSRRARAERSD